MGFLPFFSALVASHGAFRKYRPHEKQKKQKTLKVVTSSSNLSSPSFRAENRKNKIAIEDGETLYLALHCDSTLNVWPMCMVSLCVCLCGRTWSNIPAGLRGSAVVRTIFLCAACHWWIKEDYSWRLGNFGLG